MFNKSKNLANPTFTKLYMYIEKYAHPNPRNEKSRLLWKV